MTKLSYLLAAVRMPQHSTQFASCCQWYLCTCSKLTLFHSWLLHYHYIYFFVVNCFNHWMVHMSRSQWHLAWSAYLNCFGI